MKITSVLLNTRFEKAQWTLSQLDTKTKQKSYIVIPEHIAVAIIDFEKGSKDIASHISAYELKSPPTDPYFQD